MQLALVLLYLLSKLKLLKKGEKMKKQIKPGLLLVLFWSLLIMQAHADFGTGGYQYVSKLYTEALGKVPDQSGWKFWTEDILGQNDVTPQMLSHVGIEFYTCEAFYAIYGNDYKSMLLALYRGCLSREPDQAGFHFWLNLIQNRNHWEIVVKEFFDSTYFKTDIAKDIIDNNYRGWNPVSPVIAINEEWSAQDLQSRIDEAVEQNTYLVEIPQNTVIRVGQNDSDSGYSCIVVHENVTIKTQGIDNNYNAYAKMARIVRSSFINNGLYSGEIIALKPGAKLEGVWIDGQRNINGYAIKQINVFVTGNYNLHHPTIVEGCRISNTCGWTQLQSLNDYRYLEFWGLGNTSQIKICKNLITNYSGSHCVNQWSDGISIGSSEGTVSQNMIVDPTDVGIVVSSNVLHNQNTKFHYNTIANISNSAFGGIGADTNHRVVHETFSSSGIIKGTYEDPLPMTTEFIGNTIWTSKAAHINIAIVVGSGTWWHDGVVDGIIALNNQVGFPESKANVGIGIAISGVVNPIVKENPLWLNLGSYTRESCQIGIDLSFYPDEVYPFDVQDNYTMYESMFFFVTNDGYNSCQY